MNQTEMATVEGGSIWGWIGAALFVIGSFIFPPAAVAGWAMTTADGFFAAEN